MIHEWPIHPAIWTTERGWEPAKSLLCKWDRLLCVSAAADQREYEAVLMCVDLYDSQG